MAIQAIATLITNIHIPNFFKGNIYTGSTKRACVPGLNCYSCPGAAGSCPIGSMQAVMGAKKYKFSYYVIGFMMFFGVIFARLICGFLCPFGFFQDLLAKIPSKKLSTKKLKPLRYVKYMILIGLMLAMSLVLGDKYEVVPPIFCKYICPLGAFYSLFNKYSFYQMNVDKHKCIDCGKCARVCKMDVDIRENDHHLECIRCGDCKKNCPTKAISSSFRQRRENEE